MSAFKRVDRAWLDEKLEGHRRRYLRIDTDSELLRVEGLDLSGANLEGQDLAGTIFHNCLVSHANLTGANLSRTIFSGSRLDGTSLRDAELYKADFSRAFMGGVDFSHARLGKTDFMRTDLSGSSFVQADCFLTMFDSANLADCDWRDAKLDRASFGSSRWTTRNVAGMKGVFVLLDPSILVDADGHESEVSAVEFMEAMNSAGADITAFDLGN